MITAGNRLQVQIGFATDKGRRTANEDFCATLSEPAGRLTGFVAALADGVGGRAGGRVAAELAVRSFLDGYVGQSETQNPRHTGARALEAANRWIHAQGRDDPTLAGMSCTLTGLVLRGRKAHIFHVGDTRAYRLREGRLLRLTRDHRPEGGAVTNVLTRAVGAEETLRIDYAAEDLQPHDRLLLVCDGVHEPLSDRRMEDLLARRHAPDETARRLVEAALEAGSQDNCTTVVLDVVALPAAELDDLAETAAGLPMMEPPRAGETIDGFHLETQIADGRYSRVFRALDTTTDIPALLKFPKPQTLGAESSARAAFLRESWVASRVQNPFVGAVLDLPPGRRSRLYLAQPFYDGATLDQRLRRKPPVPLAEGLEIAMRLSKACGSLHRAGVIHRDIKPENVIVEAGGGLKLVDLGVARLPYLEAFPAADIPGTPSFMAPELFAGQAGDERADIFALGVTLYAMFSGGALPYGEIEPFSTPKFRRPTPLSSHRPDLPSWLGDVLTKAVSPDPAERYQDAFELAFELENGAIRAAPAKPARPSLYDRDPLRFWQMTALVLFLLLMVSLATR